MRLRHRARLWVADRTRGYSTGRIRHGRTNVRDKRHETIMPNTLVHLGVQGIGSRLISRQIDLKWVFLGCLIPDIPWILRRAIITLFPDVNAYDVTLYATVQATLLYCLLLSLVFALLSERTRYIFAVLAANVVLHLLLDATEIKWGNGVIFFAPWSWEITSFEWIWPDSLLIGVLSLVGLAFGIWVLLHPAAEPVRVRLTRYRQSAAALALFVVYTVSPMNLLEGPYSANVQSIATLQERERRIGREVRFDRRPYENRAEGDVVIALADEPLRVVGNIRATSPEVSLVGRFVDSGEIRIEQLHEFSFPWRNLASYAGLGIVALVWLVALIRERRARTAYLPEGDPGRR